MISIHAIADALMHKDVTVAGLAQSIGTVEVRGPDEYRVKPDTPAVLDVSLGIPEGKDASASPNFVQIYFSADHPLQLASTIPDCAEWRMIAGNSGASPYLYVCRFAGSTEHLEVNFVATLTADRKSPDARLVTLVIQRNVW